MPRVKIDYIVSFSNEDPENPASNLLKWDISKRKWLCNKGEASCSVVLQLANAVQIQSVHIGAHHTALVEVFVGLSEKPNDSFQVLVPSCVLVSASESRAGSGVERVRTFSGEQLTAARFRRFDRLRVVCSQPYNKNCKYGLSFIHVFSPEAEPKSLFPLSLEACSDEEDTFRPGELFAKHHITTPTATDAQIRRASANILKNISDKSSELSTTQLHRIGLSRDESRSGAHSRRETISDVDEPRPRMDPVPETDKSKKRRKEQTLKRKREPTDRRDDTESKRSKVTDQRDDGRGGVLRDVVFALSGYQNPRRALLRDTALAMGARYQPDYSPVCTHLICAFPNTPKLRAVRAAGEACVAVRGEWLEECARAGKRLPWRPYAVEQDPPFAPDSPPHASSGSDTEDEIEHVRAAADDHDSDVTQADSPPRASRDRRLRLNKLVSDFLDGWTCAVCDRLPAPRRNSLFRYLVAYGALVVPEDEAQYVVCEGEHGHQTPALRPAWLSTAHRLQEAPDPVPFILTQSL